MKDFKIGMNVAAVLCVGGNLIQGTIVGFTPKKVKIKGIDSGHVNTIMPANIIELKYFEKTEEKK